MLISNNSVTNSILPIIKVIDEYIYDQLLNNDNNWLLHQLVNI